MVYDLSNFRERDVWRLHKESKSTENMEVLSIYKHTKIKEHVRMMLDTVTKNNKNLFVFFHSLAYDLFLKICQSAGWYNVGQSIFLLLTLFSPFK